MGGLGTEPEAFMVPSGMKSRDGGCGEKQGWGNHHGGPQTHFFSEPSRALHLYSSPTPLQCKGGEFERIGVQSSGKENDLVTLEAHEELWQRIPDERDKNRLEEILSI